MKKRKLKRQNKRLRQLLDNALRRLIDGGDMHDVDDTNFVLNLVDWLDCTPDEAWDWLDQFRAEMPGLKIHATQDYRRNDTLQPYLKKIAEHRQFTEDLRQSLVQRTSARRSRTSASS
jgi:hypothetical protein